MTTLIRRTLLVSGTAALALAIMPVAGPALPGTLATLFDQQAQARGGSDDGDDDSGSDDSDDSDDDSSDDSGHDSSDDNDDSDDSDDSSDDDGPDHDSNDDHGGDRADDDSDDLDDDSLDDSGSRSGKGRGRGGDRDEIRLIVNDNQLQGLLSGSMIPVDQNGKRLRFEVEQEHGATEIKLRAAKGTLTGVTVIPAP